MSDRAFPFVYIRTEVSTFFFETLLCNKFINDVGSYMGFFLLKFLS